ncbi:hypothetical protein M513_07656 [Trichuris suis]|uniref:Uncharacterized protein n=1 Tax=Trichuris suis TaxID=68888 RepID=A0A085M2J7_9BILA|nr:hypothetical protein M513_07656 [Trichuris suis]
MEKISDVYLSRINYNTPFAASLIAYELVPSLHTASNQLKMFVREKFVRSGSSWCFAGRVICSLLIGRDLKWVLRDFRFSSMSVVAIASMLFGFLLPPASAYNYAEGYIAERLNRSSERILEQLLLRFTEGPFPWKVAQYNTKQFFPRYNRYYWIGNRYYQLDPDSQLADRLPCEYALPVNVTVLYEDDEPVKEIVFHLIVGTFASLSLLYVHEQRWQRRAIVVTLPFRDAGKGFKSTMELDFDEQPVPRSTANLFKRSSQGNVQQKRKKRKQGFRPKPNESRSAFLRRVDVCTREAVIKELVKIDFTESSEHTGRNGKGRKRCSALFSSIMNEKRPDTKRKARFRGTKKLRST